MGTVYDAIIVGARCAGSPTAMLLARKGYRVLVVDRATFPSDTVSSHIIQPPGVAALKRWGLLDRLVATGCPPMRKYHFVFGPMTISGTPGLPDSPVSYCPRRTVLDKLLVDAAVEAGAEIREGFAVKQVVIEDGKVVGITGQERNGKSVTERARVVIGADGWRSVVAEAVRPERYNHRTPLNAVYYSYWSGFPVMEQVELYTLEWRGFGIAPTNDGLTMIIGGWPYAEFNANKGDVEGHFMKMLLSVPDVADRLKGAKREERFAGNPLPNYFHKPYGPGWVLVGDAGYVKDSITAQGISDAFNDAERVTKALDQCFTGVRSFDDALGQYQRDRDEHVTQMFELTCQIATLAPPPPEMQQLVGAIHGNQQAMDGFVQMNTGVITPAQFMAAVNPGPAN